MTSTGPTPATSVHDARWPSPETWLALAAFGLGLLCYANAVRGGFVFDDIKLVVNNDIIKDPRNVSQVFFTSLWGLLGRDSNYYRPLPPLLFMLLHALFGMRPEPFHLVSIVLHAGTSSLVFLTGRMLLAGVGVDRARARWAAFAGAAVFAVHPVHTEAVAWISGLMDVACGFFSLLAIYAYLSAASRHRVTREILSAAALLLGLFSKEPAAVVPVILIAYDVLFCRDRIRTLAGAVRRWAPPLAALVAYLCLRAYVLGGVAPVGRDEPIPWPDVFLTLPRWLALYLQKLVVPVPLNVLHEVRPITSWTSPEFAWAAAVIAASALAGWVALRAGRVAGFGLLLFIMALAPALYVPALGQDLSLVFAERYLYFPSVGAAVMLSAVLAALPAEKLNLRRATWTSLIVLVAVFAGATISRNVVWSDSLTLWSDTVRKSPNLGVAREGLGLALIRNGQLEEGTRQLRVALSLQPDLAEKSLNFGTFAARKGLLLQAVLSFQTALLYRPDYVEAHYNLAVAYERMGWTAAASQEYFAALTGNPNHASAHNNLGIMLAQARQLDDAIVHFEAAVRVRPADPELRLNLARAYSAKGFEKQAREQRELAALAGATFPK